MLIVLTNSVRHLVEKSAFEGILPQEGKLWHIRLLFFLGHLLEKHVSRVCMPLLEEAASCRLLGVHVEHHAVRVLFAGREIILVVKTKGVLFFFRLLAHFERVYHSNWLHSIVYSFGHGWLTLYRCSLLFPANEGAHLIERLFECLLTLHGLLLCWRLHGMLCCRGFQGPSHHVNVSNLSHIVSAISYRRQNEPLLLR